MLLSYHTKGIIESGCDEAGRGPLAGPVTAAAVILPPDFKHKLLKDSKQLTEKQRDLLRPIIEKEAIDYSVSIINNHKIDQIPFFLVEILQEHYFYDVILNYQFFDLIH